MSGHEVIGAVVELSRAETIALADCEQRIEKGLKTFIEVGMALAAIRDNRLYRYEYESFEEYCAARWGFTGRRGRQLIEAAEIGTIVPAENEGQARELARVPEGDRESVLAEARAAGKDGKPTAKAIREVAVKRGHVEAPARRDPEAVSPASPVATTGGPARPAPETPGLVGAVPSTAPPAGPGPDVVPPLVWVAAARKGIAFHRTAEGGGSTVCHRATRTGALITRERAGELDAQACDRCFPAAPTTESPGPAGAAHCPPADPGANDRPVDEAASASTLSALDPRADGDSGRVFADPDAGDGAGRGGDGAADPSRPDTEPDTDDLAEQVWQLLDEHGNPPHGLTVGQIWTKLTPGVHSSKIQPVLYQLAAAKRAIVMGHASGDAPIADRARWLNVRRCEDCGNTATELFDNRCGDCAMRSRVDTAAQDAADLEVVADTLESRLEESQREVARAEAVPWPLTVRIHHSEPDESPGLWAEVEEMPGCLAAAADLAALGPALQEAVAVWLTPEVPA